MASGKSLEMQGITNMYDWRRLTPDAPKPRDRALTGKARIKARKRAQRADNQSVQSLNRKQEA